MAGQGGRPTSAPFYSLETRQRAAVLLELRRRRGYVSNDRLWKPISQVQQLALDSKADELFYGGAAGGGKTDLIIGNGITRQHKSIIFRREFPQLREIIYRTQEILEGVEGAKYNATDHLWRGIPGGRFLEFGAVALDVHARKYQGRAHDFKAFDEITQFSEAVYRYLIGWLRTPLPDQRTRVICTGNPPSTPEGEWVIDYWGPWLDEDIPPEQRAVPGELRWFATIAGVDTQVSDGNPFTHAGELIQPRSRTFIPARLSDNPILIKSGYGSVLQGLPEPLRSQLLFGDFTRRRESSPWQVIPTGWIEAAQSRHRASEGPRSGITNVGVDVARGGKDHTIISVRFGNWFAPLIDKEGKDTPDGPAVASDVVQALGGIAAEAGHHRYLQSIPINIDIIGVGASVYDTLRANGYNVYDVHNSAPSFATDRTGKLELANLRALAYWSLREALDPQYGMNIMLPPGRDIVTQLSAANWQLTARGIFVEDKKKIAEKIGHSPDKADAIALAWLDMQARQQAQERATSSSNSVFNPRSGR
jgi:hypothetical protein